MNDLTIKQPSAMDITAPLEQEGTKAVLRTWLKQAGERVSANEPVVELETDKVLVEVCAPCAGTLHVLLDEGRAAEPGALLGRVTQAEGSAEPVAVARSESPPGPSATEHMPVFDPQLRLSPAVRRLLAEHDMDPVGLPGTGRDGRLTREDVVKAIAEREQPAAPVPLNTVTAAGNAAHIPHSHMRRRIAEHMQHSVSVAPHVTAVFEADFSAIIAHRKKHKEAFAAQGAHLTLTVYFIAAAAAAMSAAPEVNSRWHAEYLEVFKDVNIGVGAALGDKGLIVPVVRQVQALSLLGIATRLQQLTEAARDNRLKPADVQGGTFTISNHGVSGSLFASPIIINQPQSAILGIGAVEKRVVVREIDGVDTFQARPRAYVSLTIDHRVLDGSQTNAWLSRFVQVIESWDVQG